MMRSTASLFATLLISGCAVNLGLNPLNSLHEVQADEVILVGKIILDPPLSKAEKDFPWNVVGADKHYKDKVYVAVQNRPVDASDLGLGTAENFGGADLGKTYFLRTKRQKVLYYSGGVIYRASKGAAGISPMYVPGVLKFEIAPGDKAIYIGTIKYNRDEFNGIARVEMLDDYAAAGKEFKQKFGGSIALKKVKLVPVKE